MARRTSSHTNASGAWRITSKNMVMGEAGAANARSYQRTATNAQVAASKTPTAEVRQIHQDFANKYTAHANAATADSNRRYAVAARAAVGTERVGSIRAAVHNGQVMRATGLPAPVVRNAVGPALRNPGKVGLAIAAGAIAYSLLKPSAAKAEGAPSSTPANKFLNKRLDAKFDASAKPADRQMHRMISERVPNMMTGGATAPAPKASGNTERMVAGGTAVAMGAGMAAMSGKAGLVGKVFRYGVAPALVAAGVTTMASGGAKAEGAPKAPATPQSGAVMPAKPGEATQSYGRQALHNAGEAGTSAVLATGFKTLQERGEKLAFAPGASGKARAAGVALAMIGSAGRWGSNVSAVMSGGLAAVQTVAHVAGAKPTPKPDEPKKDRTAAYTDSLGRVYAEGRKITRMAA